MSLFSNGVEKIKLSKNFNDICIKIGECKTKEAEEIIVQKWLNDTKVTLSRPKMKPSDLYENVISLIHLSLLGYNTDFGMIQAVNLTQQSNLMMKSLGYLACSALFDSQSPLTVLTVNSTQRDLSSGSPIEICLALTAISHLCTAELIQPIIGFISACLTHNVAIVRAKAIMCVHSFIRKDQSCVVEFFPELIRLLSDPDLFIFNAVVCTFTTLIQNQMNVRQITESIGEVIRVAVGIISNSVRMEYVHQRISAPFVLVNVYKLFQLVGPNAPELKEEIEPLIKQSLQTGTLESSSTAAVLYEAVRVYIAMDFEDMPQLYGAISLFMGSRDQSYMYIGLGLLCSIPDFADAFQNTIIDCLEHPDPSIKLRTLNLLHSMASPSNAQVIIINMLRFFQNTKNDQIRRDLADRIADIASRFAPSPIWFAKTMEQLFSLGGNLVRPEVAFSVMRLIDEECDDETRQSIVNLYLDVVQSNRVLSDAFVMVISHVLSKYADLSEEYDLSFIILLLCDLADSYDSPHDWVLNAILALIPKLEGDISGEVYQIFETYSNSRSTIVHEICLEALALFNFRDTLMILGDVEATPDPELSFLDEFVKTMVTQKNLPVYIPIDERDDDVIVDVRTSLKLVNDDPIIAIQKAEAAAEEMGLNTAGVSTVWGSSGYINDLTPESEAPFTDSPTISEGIYNVETGEPTADDTPKKTSLFAKVSLSAKKKGNKDAEKKEKLAASLFGAKSGKKAAFAKPAKHVAVKQPQKAPTLSAEDIELLNRVAAECNEPQPEPIREMMSTGSVIPVYSDEQMKVAAAAHERKDSHCNYE